MMVYMDSAGAPLEFDLRGETFQRGEYYCARIHGLGITAYSDSIAGARSRALQMTGLLLKETERIGGADAVLARLRDAGMNPREMRLGEWHESTMLQPHGAHGHRTSGELVVAP